MATLSECRDEQFTPSVNCRIFLSESRLGYCQESVEGLWRAQSAAQEPVTQSYGGPHSPIVGIGLEVLKGTQIREMEATGTYCFCSNSPGLDREIRRMKLDTGDFSHIC